jgi:hypothetical protein
MYVRSPQTGLLIQEGGDKYNELMRSPRYAAELRKQVGGHPHLMTKAGGCSRERKWELRVQRGQMKRDDFCGAAASNGACPMTYPADTRKHIATARSYKRYAQNPAALEKCLQVHEKRLPAKAPKAPRAARKVSRKSVRKTPRKSAK